MNRASSMFIEPRTMVRTVILIIAFTCPVLWFLTTSTNDVPGEDLLSMLG